MFNKSVVAFKPQTAWMVVLAVVVSLLLPIFASRTAVMAAVVTSRSIDMETSVAAASDVVYSVSFVTATTSNIEALVLQYCDTSPIIGDATCGDTRSFDWNPTASQIGSQVGVTDWDTDTVNSDTNTLILSRTGGAASVTASTTVSFDVGTNSGDGVTNPTGANDDFFVRIITYATDAGATSYTPGTPGTHVDDGGIAMSTAQQINVEARVQERLTFCVGTDDPAAQCAAYAGGTDVDLGVLDNGSVNQASVDGSTTVIAYAGVTTNAASGVVISYFGDTLSVSGAGCTNNDADIEAQGGHASTSKVDQCLNFDTDPDAGTVTGAVSNGVEQWGIAVTSTPDDGVTTDNLSPASAYDYDTADEWAFTAGTTATTIASSTGSVDKVVDSEQLNIDMGGTAEITTPTGLYTTTLTFIATSTF